ncbi:MAG: hypothetical protein R3Y28_02025 [Candidatus Gastranaerophilales bacterium]
MSTSISAISSAASTSYSASTTSSLSETTKERLEALGIDSTGVTSEAEAQTLIQEASAGEMGQSGSQPPPPPPASETELLSEATELANSVGVTVEDSDTVETLCSKISAEISSLMAVSAEDPTMMSEIQEYQTALASLTADYTTSSSSQSSMFAGMESIATSNKYALGLS